MKNIEKQFDKVVKFSKRTTNTWVLILLLMGFVPMAATLISTYILTGSSTGGGITGIIFAYAGISLVMLASDKSSRLAKCIAILALPLIVFFAVKLYLY